MGDWEAPMQPFANGWRHTCNVCTYLFTTNINMRQLSWPRLLTPFVASSVVDILSHAFREQDWCHHVRLSPDIKHDLTWQIGLFCRTGWHLSAWSITLKTWYWIQLAHNTMVKQCYKLQHHQHRAEKATGQVGLHCFVSLYNTTC